MTREIPATRVTENSGSSSLMRSADWKRAKRSSASDRGLQMRNTLRAALYARFSSDVQKDRSIDRQFADLEKIAPNIGLRLDKALYFADRAQSATSLFDRPGLTRELLSAAKAKKFDVVLVEATDRLSRNRADLFWLVEQFKFLGVKIYTPSGEVTDLQLTFDGHQNADFIAKLAVRIKSGHDLMTREGRLTGGVTYGYEAVSGQPGVRKVNDREAKIVRRIYTEYANGVSPREIVKGLAKDGVVSPNGSPTWNYQGIVGGDGTGTGRGLIHNDLYRGKIVRNRFKKVKNPDNGRSINRKAAEADLIVVEAPHLRIVSDELWNAAHAVRLQRRAQRFPGGYKSKPTLARKQHLLSGLLRCASCNGQMTITASTAGGRVGCSNATYRQTCDHVKTYKITTITDEVVAKMEKELTDPEFIKRRMKARVAERALAQREGNAERQDAQKKLDRLNVQIARLVAAIADSDQPVKEIMVSIQTKETERAALQERVRLLGAEDNVTVLQPAAMSAFGKSVETLAKLLRRNSNDPACRMAFTNIIDSVVVHPTPKKQPYELSMYARLSAMRGVDLFPQQRTHKEIVAAEGFSRNSVEAGSRYRPSLNRTTEPGDLILLGRWKLAA